MKRKLGNDKNYIEFEDVVTYGTKKAYDNRNRPNSFKLNSNGKEVGFELNPLDFSKSAEFVLISGCLTKLVENGVILFDRGSNPREQVPFEVIDRVIENGENLDDMVNIIIENNFTKKKSVDEEKND